MAFDYNLGYDPVKDYSLAILQAETEEARAALRRERQNKIMDVYGGIDPYKGEHEDIIRGYGEDVGAAYLNDLYAQKTAAELASLQAVYEKNAAAEKESLAAITPTYYAARNTLSAQSEKEKRAFARFGAAQGINTGAASQAELARSVTLQSDLAALYAQETAEKAAGEARLRDLEADYQLSRAQARAKGDSDLAAARYEEWVRQEKAKAEKEEFEAQQARKDAETAWDTAMAMLKAGAMPDAATLTAAGISTTDAKSYLSAVQAGKVKKSSTSSSSKTKEKEAEKTAPKAVGRIASYDDLSAAAKSMYTSFQLQMRRSGYYYVTDQMRNNLFEAVMSGTIARDEYSFILTAFGG
ncbi:MAG: hypothetical protein IKU12_05820 [Oscillospiraceae bacterium]|nr:hypothetical protein [Oscillospiraceae bacterium]